MNLLLEPLMQASDGGSAPRRRGLSESMIAGRRRPGTTDDAESASSSSTEAGSRSGSTSRSSSSRGGGRSRSRSRAKADEEQQPETEQPEEPVAEAPAGDEAPAEETEARPRRRRRSSSRSAAAEAEADAETATETETAAAERAPEDVMATPSPEEDGVATSAVEQAMRGRRNRRETEEPAALAPAEVPHDLQGLATEVSELRNLITEQRSTLAELRAGLLTLGRQVDRSGYRPRLGVFVDVPNLIYGVESAGQVHMGKLLDLLREGRQLVRATAYSPVSDDPREPLEQQKFVSPFVPYDYRIVTKPLKRFADGSIKGNFDVEMAIDMLSMADRVDVVAIVSGDADFARAVEAVQARGVRVEVIAFAGSTSLEMRALADHYLELSTVIDEIM